MNETKYNKLLHIVGESDFSEKYKIDKVKELFPEFTGKFDKKKDDLLDDAKIELFGNARSLGLSVDDAAHSVEISSILMKEFLEGKGLTLKKFTDLVEAEVTFPMLLDDLVNGEELPKVVQGRPWRPISWPE